MFLALVGAGLALAALGRAHDRSMERLFARLGAQSPRASVAAPQ